MRKMDAKKCDRCGGFYMIDKAALKRPVCRIATADNDRYSYSDEVTTIDICPECADSFEKWLKKESEE